MSILSFLKPLKVEWHIKAIIVYPHNQLFQGYSFEVAGYSVVTGKLRIITYETQFQP